MGADPDPGSEPEPPESHNQTAVTVNVTGSSGVQIGDDNVQYVRERLRNRRVVLIGSACFAAAAAGGVATWALSGRVAARPGTGLGATVGAGAIPLSPEPSQETHPAVLHRTGVPLGPPITGIGSVVEAVAFSPDGRTLAAGSSDWNTRLWDVTHPARPVLLGEPLTGHDDIVYSVVFRPDGRVLATGSADALVLLWNVANPAHPVMLGSPGDAIFAFNVVYSVAFSPDGSTLAAGCETDYPGQDPDPVYGWLWNVADPARPVGLAALPGPQGPVFTVAFSPHGQTLATGSTDKTIWLWDVTDPARPAPASQPLAGSDWVYSVAFSPDGRTLASASAGRLIQLWDVTDPANPVIVEPALAGHSGDVLAVTFSPDGRTLASGSADTTIRLWDVDNPARPALAILAGHSERVNSVAFTSDGHTLASGSSDQTIRLWRIE